MLLLAARRDSSAWVVALLATAGSVGAAAFTFWMGVKIGAHGLDRYVPPKRLKRVRSVLREHGVDAHMHPALERAWSEAQCDAVNDD